MIESKEISNPFPGLRPFEQDEYRLFFGREGQSDALIERLQRSHFLAVVGTSGSGKSSLVRAGLLPALHGGMMAGAGSGWRIAIMRPGSDPIGNLAHSLAEKDVLLEAGGGLATAEAEAVIEATLRRGSLGLVDAVRQARLDKNEKLLVVVDQFEELFRFRAARAPAGTGDDASAFVKLLLEAAQQRELSIFVVPTMRSDFLGDCAQFQGLPEAINDGQYLIPRMTRDERRFAITGPVGVKRCKITEPLVNRLMNDVGDNPDQLPILQHALMRTWDHWAAHRRNGEPIGLEHYEAVGTMSDALSKHADEAFDELRDERSRQIAEILFKALTERGADNREIRRPTCLKDICTIANATALEVGAVIEVFRGPGRSFLMPPAGVALSSDTVIDISHESLIRNWDRLKAWVRDEADSARIYRRLAGSATDYYQSAGGLLDDVTLQYVLKWRERAKPEWAWGVRYHPDFNTAMTYLELSTASRDARIEAEQERKSRELETACAFAEKQARSARRLRWLAAGMAVMFLLALATAAAAMVLRKQAKESATSAKTAQSIAEEARKSAEVSAQLLKGALDRLQLEKDKADALSRKVLAEQEKTKAALAVEEKALLAQERATRIAADNLAKADHARKDAEANAEQFKAAVERNVIIRDALEAFRRQEYDTALSKFYDLRQKFKSLQPDVPVGDGHQRTPEEARQFVINLSWTNSNIGTTHLLQNSPEDAVTRFREALDGLRTLPKQDAIMKDRLLFDTYYGLGRANQLIAAEVNTRRGRGVPAKQAFADAEEFLKDAMEFQQDRAAEKRKQIELKLQTDASDRDALAAEIRKREEQVAASYRDLGRLYGDMDRTKDAEKYLTQAKDLLIKENADHQTIIPALRELAQFYFDRDRFIEAAQVYNQLLDIQDKNVTFDQAREVADSYGDLARVYSAHKDETKASQAFKVASLLQTVQLTHRKHEVAPQNAQTEREFTYQLDQLGDAYVELGRTPQAEETYTAALDVRNDGATGESWRSYERLGNMFYNQIKGKDYSENINKKDYAEAYKKAMDNYYMLVSAFEPAPKEDVLKRKYAEGLEKLGRLYSYDASTYTGAETRLNAALAVRKEMEDWRGEESALLALIDLYKDKEQNLSDTHAKRLATMTRYVTTFAGQIGTRNASARKEASDFWVAYVRVFNESAEFLLSRKRNAEAEDAYRQAFARAELIRMRTYSAKALNTYAAMLEKYESLLRELSKPDEAVKIKPVIEAIRARQEVIDQSQQQVQQQAQPGPARQ